MFSLWALVDNTRLFFVTLLNGLTLASLYFIVASGFTLVFGLMRNVNLAHGSLYLLGGYVGFIVAERTGWWLLAVAAGFAAAALAGLLMQVLILRHMQGQDLRQTMVTIGLSIVIADLLLWIFTGQVHQMEAPAWLQGPIRGIPIDQRVLGLPAEPARRSASRIGVGLWLLLNRTRVGMMIRAGVDDRGMLAAAGVNVNLVFAITFALGAGLAGLGGVIGAVELSMVPGEDTRLLLASLIVVIVGGMGSVVGAAIGAAILGLAETYGLAYAPTYSVVFTFVILILRAGVPAARDHGEGGMSAALSWRQAMNCRRLARAVRPRRASAPGALTARATSRSAAPARASRRPTPYADSDAPRWLKYLWRTLSPRHVLVAAFVLLFPFVATPFITFQVGAQSLVLGLIALSLTFLGGYGGMVSLAQMTVAGIAGYAVAILGTSSAAEISLGWPWWVAVPFALAIATACAALIGWLSVRTEGIYTIMITLAMGVAFYYLALQNYSVFNGFQGFQKVYPPTVFGIDWRDAAAVLLPGAGLRAGRLLPACKYLVRAPFGIALQGIRDNPRRMNALGYNVVAHRVAAYAVAGLIAAVGGVLLVWYNGLITPGSVSTSWLINILVIAVLGGMRHPIGPFLGAIVFVLLQTFAIDLIDRERFNLVIGGVFLAIVLFSPDGLLGLWARLKARLRPARPFITDALAASRLQPKETTVRVTKRICDAHAGRRRGGRARSRAAPGRRPGSR